MTQSSLLGSQSPTKAPDTRDLPIFPHSYLIHHQTQICTCCHSKYQFAAVYERRHQRPRLDAGGPVDHLTRLDYPCKLFNLPIETVKLKPTNLPFCHSCYHPSLAHHPEAPRPTPKGAAPLHLYVPPPKPTAPSTPARPATPKPTLTVADILSRL